MEKADEDFGRRTQVGPATVGLERPSPGPAAQPLQRENGESGGTDKGRDGCRVPLPWTSAGESYGFSPDGAAAPWLPQPASWASLAAGTQDGVAGSTLELYKAALGLRRELAALGDGALEWLDSPADVLAFARPAGAGGVRFQSWTNLGSEPVALPSGEVLLASGELGADGSLLSDTTVWLRG